MLTMEDISQTINIDYPLSYVAEVLRECLISSGLLKNYKWKKKIDHQQDHVFNALKNALVDNGASVVFIQKPRPELLVMSEKQLAEFKDVLLSRDPAEDRFIHSSKPKVNNNAN